MLLAKLLLYILYKCIVVCIYACHGSYLRIPVHILPKPLLSKQKISNQGASNNHHRTLKRSRLEQDACFADEDAHPQHKNSKRSKRALTHLEVANTAYQPTNEDQPSIKPKLAHHLYLNRTKGQAIKNGKINKKEAMHMALDNQQSNKLLEKLPNTVFFKSLVVKINNDYDSPLSQSIIKKLDVLPRLKIPYTFLSSLLARCKYLYSFDALLNRILVKRYSVEYTIEPKLQKILNINIRFNNLSSILYNSGNQSAESFQKLINTIADQKMISKINQVKKLGFKINNLSSMLHGSGNQSAESFQKLINTIADQKMIPKINQAKKLGFKINNLSSILNNSSNQSAETFQKLINTITDQKIIPKINQVKKLGFKTENLSSILNKSGNQSYKTFQKLINTITDQKTIDKLKILKELGIQPENLSPMLTPMLSRRGNTADQSFTKLIDLLTNEKYIETIQKVGIALYTRSDIIHPNDAILVSSRASSILNDIGDLRKNASISDPSHNPTFKQFLRFCYNKHKYVDDSLLEIKKVDDDDPRVALRGQDKVVAKKKINKESILGIYTGILLCDEDPIDNAIELAYLATKNIYGLNKLNSYSFAVNIDSYRPLYLSASGRGNILMKINANHTYDNTDKHNKWSKPNVAPSLNSCDGKTPFILFYSTQDITPHTELLFDYGRQYWHNHDNNNDLSNPDANIYKNLLTTKKHLPYAESIRFLKLIKAYDKELYKDILKHIAPPINYFSGKDRVVECRKINSGNTEKIDYRIYKLPGEATIGDPSKDYFSVDLTELNKYSWSDEKAINQA